MKYTSHVNRETATAPDEKKQGFTAFVPTDKVLKEKYGIENWKDLYDKAAEIYGAVYDDAGESYYDTIPEALANRKNPLNRLVAYHILDRDCAREYGKDQIVTRFPARQENYTTSRLQMASAGFWKFSVDPAKRDGSSVL